MSDLDINEKSVEQFRKIFEDAQKEIAGLISNYKALSLPGPELGRLKVLRNQVEEILELTQGPADDWISAWLPRSYGQGTLFATSSLKEIGAAGPEDVKTGFAVIDRAAIQALAESMADDLDMVRSGMIMNVERMIRRAQLPIGVDIAASSEIARGMVMGQGISGIQSDLLKVLEGRVVPGGYKGSMSSYAELLARTRTREAQMAGALYRYHEFAVDLVRVVPHGGACLLCAPWQGAIFSISGNDKRFPPLAIVGPPPWHPNCVDVLAPVVEELADAGAIDQGLTVSKAAMKKAA